MTNEERQKLCVWLRTLSHPAVLQAADEIERLAARINALEHIIDLDMYEVTKTALVQAQEESERLAKENKELRKSLHHLHSAREIDMGTAE